LGYRCAPTTVPGYNDFQADPFELRRVAINGRATFEDFLMILYGGAHRLAQDLRDRGARRQGARIADGAA
jgi:hypothetical protein